MIKYILKGHRDFIETFKYLWNYDHENRWALVLSTPFAYFGAIICGGH